MGLEMSLGVLVVRNGVCWIALCSLLAAPASLGLLAPPTTDSPVKRQESILRILVDKRAAQPRCARRPAKRLEHDNRVGQQRAEVEDAVRCGWGSAEKERLEEDVGWGG